MRIININVAQGRSYENIFNTKFVIKKFYKHEQTCCIKRFNLGGGGCA